MKTGSSFKKALAPKIWSGWTWLITTYLTGSLVVWAIAARKRSPSVRLPPGSVTSTASLPNDKSGVGDGIVVGERRIFVNAAPNMDA